MITLYHGSLNELKPCNKLSRLYLTPSIEVANGYILAQADNMEGKYGHIYSVEIDENELLFTDDIDQSAISDRILYCIDDEYYRIDYPEKYIFTELSDDQILEAWK